MKLDEFVNKWEGKKCDFDKAFGAQCVDLFRQYCQDVLAVPHTGSVDGAEDLFLKYDQLPAEKVCFDRFKGGVPVTGDVVVWGKSGSNKYGHVAIVLYASQKTVVVFQQLGYTSLDYAHIAIRDYNKNYLGFLRKKV